LLPGALAVLGGDHAGAFPWLSVSILMPIVAGLLIPFIPDPGDGKTIRWYALGVALLTFLVTVGAYLNGYDPSEAGLQLIEAGGMAARSRLAWSGRCRRALDAPDPAHQLHHRPGGAGRLAGHLQTAAVLLPDPGDGWRPDRRLRRSGHASVLPGLGAGTAAGVPVCCDLGAKKRQYAATKFILYTAGGSVFILLAALAMGFQGGGPPSFEYTALAAKDFGTRFELLAYAGLLIAFGVKLPIVPLHTWLPDAHGEATAPVHMLLAGILLKMGGYALLRFNVQLLPAAHAQFAPLLVVLGVVNIIYAALTSFAQRNLKRKIAYSSISHMGFVLIGIGSFSALGTSGAMLQMVSHGLIGASLFFLVGATYDRTHTLQLDEMGGVGQKMRKMFALWTVCSLASLALPA